jgi:hypothetical protein
LFDFALIGHSDAGRRSVGMTEAKLEGDDGGICSVAETCLDDGGAGLFNRIGRRMFGECAFFGEQTQMNGRGIQETDSLLLQDRCEVNVHVLDERVIAAIRQDEIDFRAGRYVGEDF